MAISETEVALPVMLWLRDLGWDTYEEVQGPAGRADIVATRGRLIWVVEAKTSMSLQLIGQAERWLPYAHYVSVAVPPHKPGHTISESDRVAKRILANYGIGVFMAWMHPCAEILKKEPKIVETVRPSLRRRVDDAELRRRLHDGQKTIGKAGSQHGYWTPFLHTCENLRYYLEENDGAFLRDAIKEISHHYRTPASATGALRGLISSGVVKGVSLIDGRLFLRKAE